MTLAADEAGLVAAPDLHEIGRFLTCTPDHLRVESPGPGEALLIEAHDDIADDYDNLWRFLYAHHYCRDPAIWAPMADPLMALGLRLSDPDFVNRLARATLGPGWFDAGWTVRGEDRQGKVIVEKNGVTLSAAAEDVVRSVADAGRTRLTTGEQASVRFPNGSAGRAPGFYHVTGQAGPQSDHQIARVYLNLRAAAAVSALRHLLAALNGRRIPFTLKITADRARFGRRDNTVLYAAKEDLERVLPLVEELHAARPSAFQPGNVLFARAVLPGVSVADDVAPGPPGSGQPDPSKWSFGESRCRFLARGLLVHRVDGCSGDCDMVGVLADSFRRAGLNPSAPELVPSS